MTRRKRPQRLRLPELLTGTFTGVLIGTFGADLSFAERQLFRQLPKSVVNRVVLADARQLAHHLDRATDLRRVNRTYVAAPVRSPHAHHPKYILLLGSNEGRLLVGSGNLSIPGYTGPGECFSTYRWSKEEPEHADAFASVRELVEGLVDREWIDPVARSRVHDLFSTATWIPAAPSAASPVLHNLEVPLIDRLVAQVAGRDVAELVVAAPFHDRGARALGELVKRLRPSKVVLLVQDRQTRLDRPAVERLFVRQKRDIELIIAAAPKPYPATWLHAKFCLARTAEADVLLQGSANISTVALCEAGASANVELANLVEARPGSFDGLLEALDLSPVKAGLKGFEPSDWDEDDADQEESQPLVDTVTWTPPHLEGQVYQRIEADALTVHVGERRLNPVAITVEHIDEARSLFRIELNDDDANRIDRAPSVRIVINGVGSATVCPYHVHSLVRLTSAGHRVDLLQEAGALDLNDRELEELLAELDRVLIVDGRSLWRLAHPEEDEKTPEGSEVRLSYDELDWDRIGEQPAFRQYQGAVAQAQLAPTELGIVLKALTDRFRSDVRRGLGAEIEDDEDVDDLDIEQELEDAEEADDRSSDNEDGMPRRQAARTRVRRLWRNFVRRFVEGLDDNEFVMSVGSSVILPSYIVFNHLCRRLRAVDLIDAEYLTQAQVRLWTFMWGDADSGGYLAELPEDERGVALVLLAEHDDLPALLAAVDDAYWHVWEADADVRPLRDTWRSFLGNSSWGANAGALEQAAAVAMRVKGDQGELLDDLVELAEHTEPFELRGEIAANLGVPASQLVEKSGAVMRGEIQEVHRYFAVDDTRFTLTPGLAASALATWRAIDSDVTYLRLTAPNAVAVLDLDNDVRVFFDIEDDREIGLRPPSRSPAPWQDGLDRLLDAA